MYSVTVADHMMVAHSLRGEAFGPAQALHDVVGALSYRNLDALPVFAGVNTTTEVLARHVADELAGRLTDGSLGEHADGISAVAVTLRENPLAWASYERAP